MTTPAALEVSRRGVVNGDAFLIDDVNLVGDFIELEVVLSSGQTDEDGESVARALMASLGIRDEDLIDCAYVDLLEG